MIGIVIIASILPVMYFLVKTWSKTPNFIGELEEQMFYDAMKNELERIAKQKEYNTKKKFRANQIVRRDPKRKKGYRLKERYYE
jgi:hypothetical protein